MARIKTVTENEARGPQLELIEKAKGLYGGVVPGILQIRLADSAIAGLAFQIYQHLNLRKDSPLTRLQREMLATFVNGLIGGAP
jgi:hypothetical protein